MAIFDFGFWILLIVRSGRTSPRYRERGQKAHHWRVAPRPPLWIRIYITPPSNSAPNPPARGNGRETISVH